MASNQEIGRRLRQAREDARLTQQELGQAWGGKSHAAISDIERGATRVSASGLAELAQALNKPIEYFYGERPQARYLRDGRSSDGAVIDQTVAKDFLNHLKALRDKGADR